MQTYSLKIGSCSALILIVSQTKEDLEKLTTSDFLWRYIPDVKIEESSRQADVILILKRGANKLTLKYPRVTYQSRSYNNSDVVSLVEYLLERARQDRGYYCLHGAAVEIADKAIIFWGGASGMGKTVLAKQISEQRKGIWFADEKVVIDLKCGCVVGGVSSAYYNKSGEISYEKLTPRKNKKLPIGIFVYPFVTNESGKIKWHKWPKEKFDWHLFEELNRKIRGTSRRIFDNKEPVASLDNQALARKRIRQIAALTDRLSCYYAQGGAKGIISAIEINL